jgi:hypothetical protein
VVPVVSSSYIRNYTLPLECVIDGVPIYRCKRREAEEAVQ